MSSMASPFCGIRIMVGADSQNPKPLYRLDVAHRPVLRIMALSHHHSAFGGACPARAPSFPMYAPLLHGASTRYVKLVLYWRQRSP